MLSVDEACVSDTMLRHVSEMAKADPGFVRLLGTAREYADIYLLARNTQKGCDGMGELEMAKEEFGDSLDALINYCTERQYLSGDFRYELDSAADELKDIFKGESGFESGRK
jgi:hypothetical protein